MKVSTLIRALIAPVIIGILSLLFVSPAIWMNVRGTFLAPLGFIEIISNLPHSDTSNLEEYVPVNIYSEHFRGSQMELVSREVLTGQEVVPSDDLFDYELTKYLVRQTKLGLWASLAILLAIAYSVQIYRKSELTGATLADGLDIWCCIFLVPLAGQVLFSYFSFLQSWFLFLLAASAETVMFIKISNQRR